MGLSLEWIFNTPVHHRVHHGSNTEYLDCNFGGVLIVYDRLFGTLRLQRPDVPIRYGLACPLPEPGVFAIAFGEWKRLFADLRKALDCAPHCGSLSATLADRACVFITYPQRDARNDDPRSVPLPRRE